MDVDFEMSELGRHFEAKGRITWRDESANKVGLSFLDLPEAARGQIREWLAMKTASAVAARPTVVLDADREGASHAALQVRQKFLRTGQLKLLQPSPLVEPPGEAQSGGVTKAEVETTGKEKGDQLVQNLIDSFSSHAKKPDNKSTDAIAAWNLHSSGWNVDTGFFSGLGILAVGCRGRRGRLGGFARDWRHRASPAVGQRHTHQRFESGPVAEVRQCRTRKIRAQGIFAMPAVPATPLAMRFAVISAPAMLRTMLTARLIP